MITLNACATCGATGPTEPDTSGIERSKVHRTLVACSTCGTVLCSSPCFSMHRAPAPAKAAA